MAFVREEHGEKMTAKKKKLPGPFFLLLLLTSHIYKLDCFNVYIHERCFFISKLDSVGNIVRECEPRPSSHGQAPPLCLNCLVIFFLSLVFVKKKKRKGRSEIHDAHVFSNERGVPRDLQTW